MGSEQIKDVSRNSSNKLNIALMACSYSLTVPSRLDNLIAKILAPLCSQLFLITGRLLEIESYNVHPIIRRGNGANNKPVKGAARH